MSKIISSNINCIPIDFQKFGSTPLMAAAECGHVDILERLLTNEPAARINATNKACIHVNARVSCLLCWALIVNVLNFSSYMSANRMATLHLRLPTQTTNKNARVDSSLMTLPRTRTSRTRCVTIVAVPHQRIHF
jgi:ankyrin repeat protein